MDTENTSPETEDRLGITHYAEQDENGIDLSHLRANLRLTPTERLERHRQAHELWMEVERAATVAGLRRNPRGS